MLVEAFDYICWCDVKGVCAKFSILFSDMIHYI